MTGCVTWYPNGEQYDIKQTRDLYINVGQAVSPIMAAYVQKTKDENPKYVLNYFRWAKSILIPDQCQIHKVGDEWSIYPFNVDKEYDFEED